MGRHGGRRWGYGLVVGILSVIVVAAGVLRTRSREYSHNAAALIDGRMVTTMKEGPDGPQVRCQTESLPCSYLKLKALSQSGADVPPELHLTRAELLTLVAELDTVSALLNRYKHDITQACRAGDRTP